MNRNEKIVIGTYAVWIASSLYGIARSNRAMKRLGNRKKTESRIDEIFEDITRSTRRDMRGVQDNTRRAQDLIKEETEKLKAWMESDDFSREKFVVKFDEYNKMIDAARDYYGV